MKLLKILMAIVLIIFIIVIYVAVSSFLYQNKKNEEIIRKETFMQERILGLKKV